MVAANDRSHIREPCMVDYHVRRSHGQKSAYRKRPFKRPWLPIWSRLGGCRKTMDSSAIQKREGAAVVRRRRVGVRRGASPMQNTTHCTAKWSAKATPFGVGRIPVPSPSCQIRHAAARHHAACKKFSHRFCLSKVSQAGKQSQSCDVHRQCSTTVSCRTFFF